MPIISIILCIVLIIVLVVLLSVTKAKKETLTRLEENISGATLKYSVLQRQLTDCQNNINSSNQTYQELMSSIYNTQQELSTLKEQRINAENEAKNILDAELEEYREQQNRELLSAQQEFAQAFAADNSIKLHAAQELSAQIQQLRATFAAATEAQRRAEQIKANPRDYTISLTPAMIVDIDKLNVWKTELSNPRVLSMLIWQTYIKTPLDTLCDKLLGKKEVCGIYKLTNLITNEVYVGQSVNLRERFQQHFKKGVGIDAPINSKLYNNLQQYGVWNFAVEVLEECPRELLDEKEKFYIGLYSADHSLNSTKGNG